MSWSLIELLKCKKHDSFSFTMWTVSDIGVMLKWSGTWGKVGKWVKMRGNESVDEVCSKGRLRETVPVINKVPLLNNISHLYIWKQLRYAACI